MATTRKPVAASPLEAALAKAKDRAMDKAQKVLQKTGDDIAKEIDRGLASLEKEARGWLRELKGEAQEALKELKRRPP